MTEDMQQLRSAVEAKIIKYTQEAINKLVNLWGDIFEVKNQMEHLQILPDHIRQFYAEIIDESDQRRQSIQQDIDMVREEGDNMKRVLKRDFSFEEAPEGTPLVTLRESLNKQLEDMRNELARRQEFMQEYINSMVEICAELEEPFTEIEEDFVPSDDEIVGFTRTLESLIHVKKTREAEISTMQFNVAGYVKRLQIFLDDDQQPLLEPHLTPTKTNYRRLAQLEMDLKRQFDELCSEMDRMIEKIQKHWDFLEIEPKQGLVEAMEKRSYNQTNHCFLLEELQRCEAIKRANMETYIRKVRHEIVNLWDICYTAPEERERFHGFSSDTYTEDLLKLHELERDDLQMFYNNNAKIFEKLEEWQGLWAKLKEHDMKACDPNRFNNRGGQLLREEKERKALNARLPKVQEALMEYCHEYEQTHGRPFFISGKTLGDYLDAEYEQREEEKKAMVTSARKCANPGTPLHTSRMRTPQPSSTMRNRTIQTTGQRLAIIPKSTRATPLMMTRSENKRKASPIAGPMAKKNLMPLMNTTSANKLTGKPYGGAKGLKRRSIKRQSLKRQSLKKNHNGSKRARRNAENCPPTNVSGVSETTSYDAFENFVDSSPQLRSTMHKMDLGGDMGIFPLSSPCTSKQTPRVKVTRPTKTPPRPKTPSKTGGGFLKNFSKLF